MSEQSRVSLPEWVKAWGPEAAARCKARADAGLPPECIAVNWKTGRRCALADGHKGPCEPRAEEPPSNPIRALPTEGKLQLALDALRHAEWGANREGNNCPSCGGEKPRHGEHCLIAAALREAQR